MLQHALRNHLDVYARAVLKINQQASFAPYSSGPHPEFPDFCGPHAVYGPRILSRSMVVHAEVFRAIGDVLHKRAVLICAMLRQGATLGMLQPIRQVVGSDKEVEGSVLSVKGSRISDLQSRIVAL